MPPRLPPISHWIAQYLIAVVTMAALLTVFDMMSGETFARALLPALAWSAIASALFIGTRYRNVKRGIARSVCDTLDKK
jgi:tryptophan-rich sensory protein